MKLDQHKYALVRLRSLMNEPNDIAKAGLHDMIRSGFVEQGKRGDPDEFFVIKLRDKYAAAALEAYAAAADADDAEYAAEVRELLRRAGPNNPMCRKPD